jgi:putative intracellular protease/amidase
MQEAVEAPIGALKPPKRQRPLIAIIGVNDATEVTDYLMPYGILRRADIADVVALGTEPGPMTLYPALKIEPQATVAEFDAQHPEGADYVIVPAMSRDDNPVVLDWIKSQATKGAIIIGVCAGAKIVGAAGLLDGKRATTHWYYLKELRDEHPAIHYVADRRLVVDRGVATTTGITASMPMSLTLIEAIAGREKARAVNRDLGVTHWDALHDSHAFQFIRPFALTAIGNRLAFWNHEQLGIEVAPGVDEVSLALAVIFSTPLMMVTPGRQLAVARASTAIRRSSRTARRSAMKRSKSVSTATGSVPACWRAASTSLAISRSSKER